MRDTIKTLAGLALIAVIVVATFVYGNAQRQTQLKHDQQIQQAQQAKAAANPVAAASPTASAKPAQTPSTSAQSGNGTAPVQTPQSNSVQGGSTAKATPTPTPAKVVAVAPSTVPKTGASGAPLPQTGSTTDGLIGVAAVIGSVVALRRSRRNLFMAARARR